MFVTVVFSIASFSNYHHVTKCLVKSKSNPSFLSLRLAFIWAPLGAYCFWFLEKQSLENTFWPLLLTFLTTSDGKVNENGEGTLRVAYIKYWQCNPGHTNHRAWVGLLSPYASYALWARDSCKKSVRNTQAHNCGIVFLPCVTGYWHPVEAGPCQEGYYCPNGTLLPIPCPDNTMKNYTGGYGHVSDCTACYAGKVCVNGKSLQKFTWLLICRCILEGGVNVQCERIFNKVYRLYRLSVGCYKISLWGKNLKNRSCGLL